MNHWTYVLHVAFAERDVKEVQLADGCGRLLRVDVRGELVRGDKHVDRGDELGDHLQEDEDQHGELRSPVLAARLPRLLALRLELLQLHALLRLARLCARPAVAAWEAWPRACVGEDEDADVGDGENDRDAGGDDGQD